MWDGVAFPDFSRMTHREALHWLGSETEESFLIRNQMLRLFEQNGGNAPLPDLWDDEQAKGQEECASFRAYHRWEGIVDAMFASPKVPKKPRKTEATRDAVKARAADSFQLRLSQNGQMQRTE